ncbi:hypothetical protein C8Q80DRAFT_392265 [Daedaleopsis nitida]|nr:hypothetical protein C8Q80DRAFT_392265 [Daedaleopsis nitida]
MRKWRGARTRARTRTSQEQGTCRSSGEPRAAPEQFRYELQNVPQSSWVGTYCRCGVSYPLAGDAPYPRAMEMECIFVHAHPVNMPLSAFFSEPEISWAEEAGQGFSSQHRILVRIGQVVFYFSPGRGRCGAASQSCDQEYRSSTSTSFYVVTTPMFAGDPHGRASTLFHSSPTVVMSTPVLQLATRWCTVRGRGPRENRDTRRNELNCRMRRFMRATNGFLRVMRPVWRLSYWTRCICPSQLADGQVTYDKRRRPLVIHNRGQLPSTSPGVHILAKLPEDGIA